MDYRSLGLIPQQFFGGGNFLNPNDIHNLAKNEAKCGTHLPLIAWFDSIHSFILTHTLVFEGHLSETHTGGDRELPVLASLFLSSTVKSLLALPPIELIYTLKLKQSPPPGPAHRDSLQWIVM